MTMTRCFSIIASCLALYLTAVTITAQAGDLAQRIRDRIDAYEDAVRANTLLIVEAPTEEERARYRASIPAADPYAAEVLQLMEANPDDPGVATGINWLISQCLHLPQGEAALRLLAGRYAALPGIAPALKRLEDCDPTLAAPVLEAVLKQNTHADEQAAATYALARHQFNAFESAADPQAREAARVRAEELLQRLITDFPQVSIQGLSLSGQAAALLFEMTHLSPGATTPEISGADHEGIPFKLSDYREKHIILVFWGEWCHGCHGLQPVLAELATRFAGRPLAILGVNTDDPPTAKKSLAASTLPWRCWLDGSTSGPITSEWNLRHFPTIYLIGPDGVILEKDPSLPALGLALEKAFAQ